MVYINGATAVPWVITNKPPKIKRNNRIGINQNFFLAAINLKISFKNVININYNNLSPYQDHSFFPNNTNNPPSEPKELKIIIN